MHSAKESLGERSCEDRKVSAKNLPPEIRRLILSSLELESLKSLVKTSRLFYQQYTFDRVYILRKCLQKTLGFISIEACAVYYSGLESFTTTRGKNQVKDFLDSYVKRLSRDKASTFNGDLTNDEVIGIVKMYFSVIRPLQKHFTEWALANLAKENKIIQFCSDSDELCKPPSRSEELRMLRALYRFQLLCNLFGRGPHILKRPPTITSDFSDMLNIFFCIFEPWEVEEIGCIYFFAEQKFDQIFDAMPLDIYKETFQLQVSPTDKDTFDLDSRGQFYILALFICARACAHISNLTLNASLMLALSAVAMGAAIEPEHKPLPRDESIEDAKSALQSRAESEPAHVLEPRKCNPDGEACRYQ
ncbi:hypothetical protein FQN57_004819 [Myotisia sp. PD_48]|nr:hypothetical protein FQN57_004819 [Myotisia sp. PD_48]